MIHLHLRRNSGVKLKVAYRYGIRVVHVDLHESGTARPLDSPTQDSPTQNPGQLDQVELSRVGYVFGQLDPMDFFFQIS